MTNVHVWLPVYGAELCPYTAQAIFNALPNDCMGCALQDQTFIVCRFLYFHSFISATALVTNTIRGCGSTLYDVEIVWIASWSLFTTYNITLTCEPREALSSIQKSLLLPLALWCQCDGDSCNTFVANKFLHFDTLKIKTLLLRKHLRIHVTRQYIDLGEDGVGWRSIRADRD